MICIEDSCKKAVYDTYAVGFAAAGDEDFDCYKLVETMVKTLEGNNLGVVVSVREAVPSHGVRKVIAYHGNMMIPQSTYGDPLDLASGAFRDTRELLKVSDASELAFEMQYDSMLTEEAGEMGYGWHHGLKSRIKDKGGMLEFYSTPNSHIPFYHTDYIADVVYGKLVGDEVILQEVRLQ